MFYYICPSYKSYLFKESNRLSYGIDLHNETGFFTSWLTYGNHYNTTKISELEAWTKLYLHGQKETLKRELVDYLKPLMES